MAKQLWLRIVNHGSSWMKSTVVYSALQVIQSELDSITKQSRKSEVNGGFEVMWLTKGTRPVTNARAFTVYVGEKKSLLVGQRHFSHWVRCGHVE